MTIINEVNKRAGNFSHMPEGRGEEKIYNLLEQSRIIQREKLHHKEYNDNLKIVDARYHRWLQASLCNYY